MKKIIKEISKNDYLKYKVNPADFVREHKETLPVSIVCGLGWYGCRCYESSNGHYYMEDEVGESCD